MVIILLSSINIKFILKISIKAGFSTLHNYLENPEQRQYIVKGIRAAVSGMNSVQPN